MIERNPEQSYFLATDSRAVQRQFAREYDARIRRWPTRFSLWWRLMDKRRPGVGYRASSMEDALAEMPLLGRCRRVVGAYYSSFGEFAAVWGLRDFSTMTADVAVPVPVLNHMTAALGALEE